MVLSDFKKKTTYISVSYKDWKKESVRKLIQYKMGELTRFKILSDTGNTLIEFKATSSNCQVTVIDFINGLLKISEQSEREELLSEIISMVSTPFIFIHIRDADYKLLNLLNLLENVGCGEDCIAYNISVPTFWSTQRHILVNVSGDDVRD